ncbi:MAG TPA: hypothetical protein VHW92_12800, partial [Mycobacteriales bacterium]|nr:hypothetical protein [Mycobacteriales bacterium]
APGAPKGVGDGKGGNGSSSNNGGTGGGTGSRTGGAGTPSGGNGAGTGATGGANSGTGAKGAVDPATGQVVGDTTGTSNDAAVIGQPADIPTSQNTDWLGPLAGVLLLAVLIGPPLLSRRLRSHRGGS